MDKLRGRLPRPERAIHRRRFLILAGGAAAYLALRPHGAWARRAARPQPVLQPWTLPDEPPAGALETARSLVAAAVLAPSLWNSQPWRFEVEGSTIRLVADGQRSLPITDPAQRGLMISLGAALENLLVAARAYGLRPNVTYAPHDGPGGLVAEVTWSNGDLRRDRPMFGAIVERRTNRRMYDERGILAPNRAQLIAQVPEGFLLHWIDDRDRIESVADLAHQAIHERVLDRRAEAEQYSWMRFDDDARRRGDGVSVDELELGGPARWMAGRYFNPESWFLRFGAQSAAKQARSAVRSAGALALLVAVRGGEAQWLTGGQAYERFALKATTLGIAHQPINALIESDRYRAEVLRQFAAGGEEPLMLLRLGHSKSPPPAVRRNVALVASFRNS